MYDAQSLSRASAMLRHFMAAKIVRKCVFLHHGKWPLNPGLLSHQSKDILRSDRDHASNSFQMLRRDIRI